MTDLDTLARELLAGSTRALARGLTWVESGGERAEALVARVYPRTGRAHVVGLTGAPGSGKSTLARALARTARARGRVRRARRPRLWGRRGAPRGGRTSARGPASARDVFKILGSLSMQKFTFF